MTQGTQCWFYHVRIFVVLALAAVGGAMLVDFSPSMGQQTVLGVPSLHRGLAKAASRPVQAGTSSQLVANYGKLPLGFEVNQGQSDAHVKFLARGKGYSLFLTGDEAVLKLRNVSQEAKDPRPNAKANPPLSPTPRPADAFVAPPLRAAPAGLKPGSTDRPATGDETSTILRMRLVGGNLNAAVTGADQLPGKSNYFIGNDPKKWHTNIANYARVKYSNVYPGVDLAYYGNQGGHLEYDFVVAPGADPAAIRLAINAEKQVGRKQKAGGGEQKAVGGRQEADGSAQIRIAANGDLVIQPKDCEAIGFHKPVVYQESAVRISKSGTETGNSKLETRSSINRQSTIDHRQFLEGHYVLRAENQVGFAVAAYDHTKPLIIDPVLAYSTFLDGSIGDGISGIRVDSSGNTYVAGTTSSPDFPTTTGTGGQGAYVTKLDPTGSFLIYSTFLGGGDPSQASSIAVDSAGDVYVGGWAYQNFPTTAGAFQTTNPDPGGYSAFVAKLNPTGSGLVYSTWFGYYAVSAVGLGGTLHVAADPAGNAYIVMDKTTLSATPGAFQSSPPLPINPAAYPSNIVPGGYPAPTYCTTTCSEVFLAKLNPTGSSLLYATYLDGSGNDNANGITVDSSGDAYVTGYTESYFPATVGTSFPTTAGAFQTIPPIPTPNCTAITQGVGSTILTSPCFNGSLLTYESAFVAEFNPTGSLVYSTLLGGGYGFTVGDSIAVDGSGDAYVAGATSATTFPTTSGTFQTVYGGGTEDGIVAKLNPAGSALIYSTYLGGSGIESAASIVLDSLGDAYVTGTTTSTNFPTMNPFQATNRGGYYGYDGYIAELNAAGSTLVYSTYLGGNADDISRYIGIDSKGNAYVAGDTYSSNFPTTAGAFQTTATVPSCPEFPAGFVPFTTNILASPNYIQNIPGYVMGVLAPGAWTTIQSLPLPNVSYPLYPGQYLHQGFCEPALLFASSAAEYGAGIPTAEERAGYFGFISTPIIDPATVVYNSATGQYSGRPWPGNAIPPSEIGKYFLWSTDTIVTGGPSDFVAKISLAVQVGSSPTSLSFGSQNLSTPSAPLTETITNNGTDPLIVFAATVSGTNASDFSTSDDSCTGATVAPAGMCSVTVTFTPSAQGSRSASLAFADNSPNSPQTVSLSGTGAFTMASVSVPSLAFANQLAGTTSASQPVTVSNTGDASLNIFGIAVTAGFSEIDNCGTSVPANGSCTIYVSFVPSASGPAAGTLTITDNSNDVASSTQTVTLSGTGTQPGASLSAPSLSFGNQPLSTASSAMMETLTNSGTANLSVTTVWIGGTNPTDFSKSADTCTGATVAPSGTCTVSVTFTPAAPASRSAVLNFTDNASGSPQTAPLSGTGTGVTVSFSPTTLTFAAQTSGTTSSAQTVTVTNTGNQNLTFTGMSVAAPFAIASTGTTCLTANPVAGGGACTVAITFAPTAGGSASGSLSFADNASSGPQSVAITGTGQDFAFAPPAGSSTSASTAPGTPATFTLSVGGQGGLTGTVNFAVTGCPSATTCTVSPNPVTAGSTPTNVTVTATTTAASMTAPGSRPLPPVPPLSPGLKNVLLLALALATLAWAVTRRRRFGVRRRRAALLPIAAGGLLLVALTACGGSGSSSGTTTATPGTPPGTYTLTVTGTTGAGATALSHSVTLTLTVS